MIFCTGYCSKYQSVGMGTYRAAQNYGMQGFLRLFWCSHGLVGNRNLSCHNFGQLCRRDWSSPSELGSIKKNLREWGYRVSGKTPNYTRLQNLCFSHSVASRSRISSSPALDALTKTFLELQTFKISRQPSLLNPFPSWFIN